MVNSNGASSVEFLRYGCSTSSWRYPKENSSLTNSFTACQRELTRDSRNFLKNSPMWQDQFFSIKYNHIWINLILKNQYFILMFISYVAKKKCSVSYVFIFHFYGTHTYDIECNSLKTAFAIKVRHILVINNTKQRCRQKCYYLHNRCLHEKRK